MTGPPVAPPLAPRDWEKEYDAAPHGGASTASAPHDWEAEYDAARAPKQGHGTPVVSPSGDVDFRGAQGSPDNPIRLAPVVVAAQKPAVPGLLTPGNIDVTHRPRVKNPDGSISTVKSFSTEIDGKEVLLPLVGDDGRMRTEDEAVADYTRTGKHLGIFDSPDAATAYAKRLHEAQAAQLEGRGDGSVPVAPTAPTTPHAPATAINDPVKAAAVPTMAPSDATRQRPERNPQAHQLTGLAKKASDVFESMANNPVTTATALPLAPIKSAFTAGRYLGQQISEDPSADADASRSLGIDPVTGKEAAIAGAQTALMAGGAGLLGKLAGRAVGAGAEAAGASPVVAKGLAGTAHVVTEGGSIGAAYDPEHPARGAAIGAGLGVLANEAGGVLRRRILPLPEVEAVPAERGLPSGNPTPAPTAARVVEEPVGAQTAAPAEPDFAVEQTPQHDALEQEFEAWKRAQGTTTPATEAPAVEPPPAEAPVAAAAQKPAVPEQHDFSSTQVELPEEHAAAVRQLASQIPDEHMAPDGREDAPHITVKYGLHGNEPEKVRALLADEPPITVTLGKTSVFPDSGSGDVVKVDVDSPDLHRLNKKIADALPHTDTHPEYKPHATVAYVKKGLGQQYAGNTSLAGRTMTLDRITFSGKDGKKIEIPLGGAAPAPASGSVAAPAASVQAEAPASSVTFRDLITMPRDEIRRLADEATTADKNLETDIFGAEGAKRYKALQARANSTIRSHAETNTASDEVAKMEDALTPEQRNRLYGIGQPGMSADELREAARAVEPVDDMDTALLQNTVAREMTTGQPHTNAASALRLREAMAELQRRTGHSPEDILNRAVVTRGQMGGLSSVAQARELVAARLTDLRNAGFFPDRPAAPEAANAPATLPTTEPVRGRLPAPVEPPALPAGRVLDEDGVVRHESARTPGGTLRPVGRVSTPGLLDELLNLERQRAKDEALAPYELRDDPNFHTSGIPQIVSTKQQNGRGSVQSEALQRLKGYAGVTDRIHAELATRMPESDVWSALEDRRAMHDERAGLAGQFEPGAMGRQPIRDASDKVLFARASGGGPTRGARASAVQGRDLFGNAPEPSPADQTSLFGGTAGTEGARSLAETERAAQAELAQLREKLPRTRPDARAPIAARIAELEKLVNRGKAITPDELRVRAAAEAAAQSPSPPAAGTARPGPSPTEEPTLFARSAAPPRAGQPGPRGASHAPPGVEPADVPSPKASRAEPPPKVAAGRLGRFLDDIKVDLAPHTRSEEAGRMARITNAHTGAQAQQLEQAHEALRSFAKSFDRMPEATQLDFIDRLEHGLPQETPALTRAAALIRGLLDTARDEIRALGTGKLEQWLEDYFPHIWKDPNAAAPIIGRILGKRPLEGPKSFLKKRTIPTTKEGIAAGLVPVTTNPVDLTLLKLKEMRRYLAAHRILQEAEGDGLLKYVPATEMGPQGWRKIEDRIGTVYGKPTVEASEAFDKQVRQGLEAAIERLTGLSHERRARTGKRGALGYAKGADEMVTKFGTDDGVMMHELGHILDARYGLWRRLASDPRTVGELQDLAKLRHESGEAKPSFTKYVQKPEEQIANALHALLHAPERMAQVAPATKRLLESFLASKPELKPLLDIKPSLELATGTTEIPVAGLVVRGHYWAPEPVTNVLANYLSPGLRGKAWYGLYGGLNNGLNQAQLGLSAFHVGFTSLDAMVSQFADGLQHLVHGRGLTGVGKMATYPAAPVTTMLRGHRLMRAYLNPETASPELVRMVRAITEAGGRAKQDSFYQTGQAKAFMQALRRASAAPLPRARELLKGTAFDNAVGEAALRFVPALFDAAAKPVMEFVVPRQKLGVFMQMAQRALDDLPEGATVDDTRKALNRAWDSVDNRLGQLVYDRLFWNKTFKDLAMVSVRSVGWNLGTIREIGGGSVDLVRMANDAFHGRRPDVTERASYNIALPLVLGLSTAIGTYLLTGEGPKELKDYYTIRTGKQNVEGNEERMQLPSYMKDIVAYKRHPVTTVEHKVAPAMAMIVDMLHNEDFYGDQIRNADDPFVQQMQQVTEYLLKGAIPFGIRNAQEAGRRVVDPRMKVAGFVGVTATPREETRTPAENKMMEYLATKAPPGATPEARDARTARSDLMTAAREGTLDASALDRAQTAGTLSDRQRRAIEQVQDGEGDVWLSRFNRLSADEALRVYKLASPTEQAKYREALESKLIRADREDELDQLPPLHVSSTSAGRP